MTVEELLQAIQESDVRGHNDVVIEHVSDGGEIGGTYLADVAEVFYNVNSEQLVITLKD